MGFFINIKRLFDSKPAVRRARARVESEIFPHEEERNFLEIKKDVEEASDRRAFTHLEVRPVVSVFGPALQHQLEDVPGTVVGLAQHLRQGV